MLLRLTTSDYLLYSPSRYSNRRSNRSQAPPQLTCPPNPHSSQRWKELSLRRHNRHRLRPGPLHRPRGHLCHCDNCRKTSGSAYGANLSIESEKSRSPAKVEGIQRLEDAERNTVSRFFCGNWGSELPFFFKANISRWHVLYLDGPPPIRSQPNIDHNLRTTPAIRKLTSVLSPVPSNPSPPPHRAKRSSNAACSCKSRSGSGELHDTAPEMEGRMRTCSSIRRRRLGRSLKSE
jgi:hypothetical protein